MRPCAETLDGEMSKEESDLLLKVIYEYKGERPHVEIGTAAGGTLWRMIKCLGKKHHPIFVVVDPMGYFPNQLETVKNNLIQHNVDLENVEFRQMPSSEALIQARKKKEKFSFILIDGRHKIRYVMEDLMWGELIEAGGFLCLHDYTEAFPGVMKSVNWFIRNNEHYKVEAQAGSLLVLRKEKESDVLEVGALGILYAWCWAPYLQILPSVLKRVNKYKHVFRVKTKGDNGV